MDSPPWMEIPPPHPASLLSWPTPSAHTQTPNPGIQITQTATALTLHSTRRLAQLPGLVWQLHTSRQLAHWTEWTGPGQPVLRPLFDGSGTAQITYDLTPTPTPDAMFRLMIKP